MVGRPYRLANPAAVVIYDDVFVPILPRYQRMPGQMDLAHGLQSALAPTQRLVVGPYELVGRSSMLQDVGGDYYDFLKKHKNLLPIVIADVEGKGLSAALLAASSQAIFRALNELYFFEPARFMAKANSLIYNATRGRRFITLFWMLLNDNDPAITYVNAGHVDPYLITGQKIRRLSKGGFFTGFREDAVYEEETIPLKPGDMITVFTDGVHEVENPAGQEFGEAAIVEFIQANCHLNSTEILDKLYKKIKIFAKKRKFRDDFTIILLKVR